LIESTLFCDSLLSKIGTNKKKIDRPFVFIVVISHIIDFKMIIQKLLVLGKEQVGKTSICTRFCVDTFPSTYTATIEDEYKHRFNCNGKQITLEITDTGHSSNFSSFKDLYFNAADGFLMVLNVGDRESLTEVKRLREEILESKCDDDAASDVREEQEKKTCFSCSCLFP
jgi:GTPase SAR1 family protein